MSRFDFSTQTRLTMRPISQAMFSAGLLLTLLPAWAHAQALPSGPLTPVVGDATVVTGRTPTGPTMTIEQTSNLAVFRWDTFNIGATSALTHVMAKSNPNPQALTVHHVYDLKRGASTATIEGAMTSDHRVFLVSPGGVRVAGGATVEAPGLMLSSRNLSDDQFAKGSYAGLKEGGSIKLVQASLGAAPDVGINIEPGAILRVGNNGGLLLQGSQVTMNGLIEAGAGSKIVLAALSGAEVPLTDSGFLSLKVQADPADASAYVSMGGQIVTGGAATRGHVELMSGSNIYMGPGAVIASTEGAVDITMQSAMSGRQGELYLYGYGASDYYAAAALAAPSVPGLVTIQSGGGDIRLSGADGQAAKGIVLSNTRIDAGAGRVEMVSLRDTGSEGSNAAIDIRSSSISGAGVQLNGRATASSSNGIVITNTDLRGNTDGVVLRGVAIGSGTTEGVGINLGPNTVIHGGAKGVELYGRGTNQGIRFSDLTLTTAGSRGQRIVMAGQTLVGSLPGLGFDPQYGGRLRVHDEQGSELASAAEMIVGGTSTAEAPFAIDLGRGESSPFLNLVGRYNLRPLGVNESGQAQESFGTLIQVGQDASEPLGRFLILPEWFNKSANGNLPQTVVIGSSGHREAITTVAGALDGVSSLTLQNQGASSKGIVLGAGSEIGTLNLVTAGPISQTGPLEVNALNVIVPRGTSVQLDDKGNRFGALAFEGATPASFDGAAVPSASDTSGIAAFQSSTSEPQFQTLAITRFVSESQMPTLDDQTGDQRVLIPRVLEEQRTDVYVRDAFNKPQVCTGVTAAAQSVLTDAGVEPLTLEWLKVRQSPQLSSCSGARVNASCSVF